MDGFFRVGLPSVRRSVAVWPDEDAIVPPPAGRLPRGYVSELPDETDRRTLRDRRVTADGNGDGLFVDLLFFLAVPLRNVGIEAHTVKLSPGCVDRFGFSLAVSCCDGPPAAVQATLPAEGRLARIAGAAAVTDGETPSGNLP